MKKSPYINSVNLYAGTNFPYLVLNVSGDTAVPRNPGFKVMHWHEDLQFILVHEGSVCVRTLSEEERLSAGEGIFINKNVVHLVEKIDNCRYSSFIFPEKFLFYYEGSPAEAAVKKVTEESGIDCFLLKGSILWQKHILRVLEELSGLQSRREDPFYAFDVMTRLNELFLVFLKNFSGPKDSRESVAGLRMRTFLQYIESHYAGPVTLEALAESAHVSKSECLRCFKQILGTTPYRYLMEFRLFKAAKLLSETALPVGRIAEETGFSQQSYFGRCFRESTGLSPAAYRRIHSEK